MQMIRFGGRILAVHTKDMRMKEHSSSVILEEVIPDQGNIDIAATLRELHKLPQPVTYMMEHLADEDEYDQAAHRIRQVATAEGISI